MHPDPTPSHQSLKILPHIKPKSVLQKRFGTARQFQNFANDSLPRGAGALFDALNNLTSLYSKKKGIQKRNLKQY